MTEFCECPQSGWCERHGVHKHQRRWELCRRKQNSPYRDRFDYFDAWEDGSGPGQDGTQQPARTRPGLMDQAGRFGKAIARFVGDGMRTVDKDAYQARLDICAQCPHLDGRRCGICGCVVTWKAKPRGERCPRDKWPHPEQPATGFRFAVAVTTAYRKRSNLDDTLAGLLATGFHKDEIMICAEPQSGLSGYARSFQVYENAERQGCWRNYVRALRRLLETDANALMVVQDDVVFCRNVRAMLERDLWPSPQTGVVSIYAPDATGYESAAGFYGYKLIMQKNLIGACAMVFPRRAAKHLVERAKLGWKGRVKGRVKRDIDKKAVDAWIGHALRPGRFDVYFTVPSVVQHVGATSSVGHKGLSGLRVSARFPGVDADALEVIPRRIPKADPRTGAMTSTEEPDVRNEQVTAIIPAHECFELTRKCLVHVGRSHQEIDVIYVDNGSSDATVHQVEQTAEDQGVDLTVIHNRSNRGFSRAINQGLEALPDGHYALLLNNDCFVTPEAVTRMLIRLRQHDRIAAINPTDVHSITEQSVTYRDRLAFYATLIRPEALQNVGLLDCAEPFAAGLGADDDWCKRAKNAGWHLAVAHDAKAKHLHKESFRRLGINRKQLQQRAKAYLRKKWANK